MSRVMLGLVVLTVAVASAVAEPAARDATVVLKSGWTYKTVAVTLLADGQSLEITRPDGASLVVPAADVAAIRDAQGSDITAQVIPAAAADAWNNEVGGSNAPAPVVVKAPPPPRLFDVTVGAGVGYGFPFGEFYDGLDAGLLYGGEVRIATTPRNYIKLCYRSQNVYSETFSYTDPYSGQRIDVDTSLDLRQYLLLVGFLSNPRPGSSTRGYTEIGLGYGDHVASASSGSQSANTSEGRLLLAVQGGAMIPFGKDSKVGADIGGFLLAKLIGDQSGEGVGFVFGLQAGLVVAFGGEKQAAPE